MAEGESRPKRQRNSLDDSACESTMVDHRPYLPFEGKCPLCDEQVTLFPNHPKKARTVYREPDSQTHVNLKSRWIQTAQSRIKSNPKDAWAVSVKGRLEGMGDLVAEGIIYHIKCSMRFTDGRLSSSQDNLAGRPVSDDCAMLLEQLFEWLDANLESNVFEVSYLVEKMIELDSSPDKSLSYSHRHLKRKLTEHYGNILFFTNQARRKDLICLRDNTANILRDHQKNTMTTDAGGTKSRPRIFRV